MTFFEQFKTARLERRGDAEMRLRFLIEAPEFGASDFEQAEVVLVTLGMRDQVFCELRDLAQAARGAEALAKDKKLAATAAARATELREYDRETQRAIADEQALLKSWGKSLSAQKISDSAAAISRITKTRQGRRDELANAYQLAENAATAPQRAVDLRAQLERKLADILKP